MKRRIFSFLRYLMIVTAVDYFTSVHASQRQPSVDDRYECSRSCVSRINGDGARGTRTCSLKLIIESAIVNDNVVTWRVVNGTSPGPSIEICLGDAIVVIVENGLSSEEVSLHWHGLRQMGSPHMDGVTMVSQCPILPHTSFRYAMTPDRIGTYFYHAHSVRQQGDGIYGSLIVRDPRDDASSEFVILVSSRSSGSLSELVRLESPVPRSLLVNGKTTDRSSSFNVESGRRYLFRLVNANVYNCPVSFWVVGHRLDIVATDAHPLVAKISAERIIIFPGERFDVAISANQTPGDYVIGLQGFEDCRDLRYETLLSYDPEDNGKNVSVHRDDAFYLLDDEDSSSIGKYCKVNEDEGARRSTRGRTICSLDLVNEYWQNDEGSSNEVKVESMIPTETHYVPFDVSTYGDIDDGMTDYSFNIYDFSYYPSYLTSSANPVHVAQINRMTFESPSSPILSQPEAIDESAICSIGKRAKHCHGDDKYFCHCTQILELTASTTADIVLVDEGFGSNVSHTFHVHGYDVGIVEVGQFDVPMRMEEMLNSIEFDVRRRRERIVDGTKLLRKDTFVVPNKGYVVVRIHTDNVGYWLWEARDTGLWDANNNERPPMQFLMLVGNRESLPIVPIDFPTCGNLKSPASIFEDSD